MTIVIHGIPGSPYVRMPILAWYVMPSLTGAIGFNRVVKPMLGRPIDEDAIAAAIPLGRTSLKALEQILGSNPYFAGDNLSLADLAAVAHLDMVPASPEGAALIAGSPLLDWLARMSDRDSVRNSTMQRMMGAAVPA